MRGWYRLFELLVRQDRPRRVLWLAGPEGEELEAELAALLREAGAEFLRADGPSDLAPEIEPDLVVLDGEPNWYWTLERLRWLAGRSEGGGLPAILVPRVSWPYGRRDGYPEGSSVPPEHRHQHRRGGLLPGEPEPVAKGGFAPGRAHALREHPFRNGRLTAIEDFLREAPPGLRFRALPGFQGLGVLAPEERIARSPGLRRLFEDPGGLLLDLGYLEALEEARLAALAAPEAEAPVLATPAPPAPPAPAAEYRAVPNADVLAGRAARLEGELTAERAELRRLAAALLEVRGDVLDLLRSRRWRMGNRLGDLYLKLARKRGTETAAERLTRLFAEIDRWDLAEKVRRGRAEAPPVPAPGPAAAAGTAAPDAGPGLFHRLLAGVELGSLEGGFRTAWGRTEERVQHARSRALRSRPLVSVIMPTRDRAHVLGDAVTSVLEQTYGDWELIVCADGGTAGTEEAVRGFGDPRIELLAIERAGAAAARNRALGAARGEVIAYLDDDNLWHPAFLKTLVGALDARPAFAGAFGGYIDVEIQGDRSVLRGLEARRFDYEALRRANFIDLNTLVHRRELYDLFGGFDESLTRHQDWDLVLRYGFVSDLLPVEAMLTLYRRNPEWRQISGSRRGSRSWDRVRAATDRAFEDGGPRPVAPRQPGLLALLFDARSRDSWARAEGLARAAARRREVRLVPVGPGNDGDLPDCVGDARVVRLETADEAGALALAEQCREGFLWVLDAAPAAADLATAASGMSRAVVVVERKPGEVSADAAPLPPQDGRPVALAAGVLQALSPAAVPPGLRWAPPVSLELIGADAEPDPEDRASRPVLGVGGSELAEIEAELRAAGVPFARVEPSGPGWERAAELRRLLESAGILLVVPESPGGDLDSLARQAVVEACAARVPVIALPCEEVRPLADDGCLTLAAGHPSRVAARIQGLVREPGSASGSTERAWRLACRRFAPGAAANALDLLLLELRSPGAVREPRPEDPVSAGERGTVA